MKKEITVDLNNITEQDGCVIKIGDEFYYLRKVSQDEMEEQKEPPFKRVEKGQRYYYIDMYYGIDDCEDRRDQCDDINFKIGNYCTDEDMLYERLLHETLDRLLWRYSKEHCKDLPWDGENYHFCIVKDTNGNVFPDSYRVYKMNGVVYFDSYETAENAIKDIVNPFFEQHPDFEW